MYYVKDSPAEGSWDDRPWQSRGDVAEDRGVYWIKMVLAAVASHSVDGGIAAEAHGLPQLVSLLSDFAWVSEISVGQLKADGVWHPV